jgi:protease PrsW
MHYFLLSLLAIIPGIVLVYYYYKKDKYRQEPLDAILITFLWGTLSTVPAILFESAFGLKGKDIFSLIIEYFFVVGFSEEVSKLIFFLYIPYKFKEFDEIMDGFVYGAAIASGFATLENLFYVLEHGYSVGIVRAFVSVPSHILEGAWMGYWFALYKFHKANLIQALVYGLGFSIFIHGLFDFLIMVDNSNFSYLCIIPVILLGYFVNKHIKIALEIDAVEIFNLPSVIETQNIDKIMNEEAQKDMSTLVKFFKIVLFLLGISTILFSVLATIGYGISYYNNENEDYTSGIIVLILLYSIGFFMLVKSKKQKANS